MGMSSKVLRRIAGTAGACAVLLGLGTVANEAAAGIQNTRHNLGANQPAALAGNKTTSTGELCVFCHTPHGADVSNPAENPPLWNKRLSAPTGFSTYAQLGGTGSATIQGTILGVGSVSVACLSCHDGSQAIDNIINAPGSGGLDTTGGGPSGLAFNWTGSPRLTADGFLQAGAATNLGKDLTNDHPIGIQYCGGGPNIATPNAACRDGDFVTPRTVLAANNAVQSFYIDTSTRGGTNATTLDKTDLVLYNRAFAGASGPSVECGSCHDPHTEAQVAGQVSFMRISNANSNLCLSCHNK